MLSNSIYPQSYTGTISFDNDWLFKRYGLQADGTRVKEPGTIWTDTQANYPWRTIQKAVKAVSRGGNIKYRNVHLINY